MNNKREENEYWIGDPIQLNEEDLELLKGLNYDVKSKEPLPNDVARIFILHKIFKGK